ncbi:hypothetical protein K435DRAFT_970737 [Dendrothele bispora CBS 962.96]|uniref:Alanine dehydrogenase/pyridine nucleotide transhydrogenase N-terminal domain-containing protein n=1 Tax=Dendrothele bispora (strain CBS 962.96) TaxID=1314807 RepID=A0A4S8L9H8_DENBC|nr:hypothetical protein K435DRAFT_970737 [Dendrothele bispora CBS 962.96]
MKPTKNLKSITRARLPLTVGIRREDPSRIWERRAPLTPDAVNELVERRGIQVHVEQCDRRIFTDKEYEKAGATIRPNLQTAHVVLGIKEPPLNELLMNPLPSSVSDSQCARTYMMFSHTAKGQAYNMPLLSAFLANDGDGTNASLLPTLIDYELLTNEEDQKRTVGFGWFAGVAGVLESLSSMAHSHLELGVASPFLYTPRPHTLPSLSALRASLRAIGSRIANEGTPKALGPFVIGLTGTGNVSQGCLSMLEELPIVPVAAKDLPALVMNSGTDLRKIYLVHAKPAEYLIRCNPTSDGSTQYDRDDYYANPEMYKSVFGERIYPYLTLFLNGTGWAPGYPRLMTNGQLTHALELARLIDTDTKNSSDDDIHGSKPPKWARGRNIGDISCDPEGGLEFLERASTLSDPFYKIKVGGGNGDGNGYRHNELPGSEVQMMAVDILPASIPLDASVHFSDGVMRYLEGVLDRYSSTNWNAQSEEERALRRATITQSGKLVEKHEWLGERVDTWRKEQHSGPPASASFPNLDASPATGVLPDPYRTPSRDQGVLRTKRILLLGSGMVAGPAVEKIAERPDVKLVVASNSGHELNNLRRTVLASPTSNQVEYKEINVGNKEVVESLIREADVVISLLPVPLHAGIAELCIQQKKHLVTASYISDDMRKLHDRAHSSDVLLLNEIGLDPGIDHCSAISLIRNLEAQNKQIVSFTSFCGGLPAPDIGLDNMGPLRYKFSWSPRGVLTAALNAARFKLRGKEYEIPGNKLLSSYFEDVPISPTIALEGLPNRDSFPYAAMYELGDIGSLRTLLRGTLRYKGFSSLMHFFNTLGLLELSRTIKELRSWHELVARSQILRHELRPEAEHVDLSSFPAYSQVAEGDTNAQALSWLFNESTSTGGAGLPPLPKEPMTPLDMFTLLLAHKLKYAPHERDMVVMSHEVIARDKNSGAETTDAEEIHTSSLIAFGNERYSAMARTVGMPVAIAALAVADGKVDSELRGVTGPGHESVRGPVLNGLVQVGLGMEENIKKAWVGSLERELRPVRAV